jgi:RimJ/RimL family protein N-acetyltransferase
MFLIMVPDESEPVGSVGYWEREWRGETVYEMGWKVASGFQGRGLAVRATVDAIRFAAAEQRYRWAHAYPKVDNGPSNAVCRKAGFTLLGECDFEFPKGNPIRCSDWRYDLTSLAEPAAGSGPPAGRA